MDGRAAELASLERQRASLLEAQSAQQAEVQRLEAVRKQMAHIEARGAATALPLDPLDRERVFAAHRHLGGTVAGFVHTLAELDFGEEAVLLGAAGGPPAGGNRLDDSLQSMRNQLVPCAREVQELPDVVRGPLSDALQEIFAILTPRPAHIARLVGPARLHLDLRFVHVNMQRLSAVAEKLNMDLIHACLYETLVREDGH
jgi:hypothetical protein